MSAFLARRAIAAPQLARTFSSTSARPVAKITVIGTLGATPEIQATSTGREILKYSVASNTRSRGETKTSWWRVTCFNVEGNRRDFFQSLPKGTMVYLEGDASMNTFVDSDGKNRSTLNIVQRNLEVLRRPAASRESEEGSESEQEMPHAE